MAFCDTCIRTIDDDLIGDDGCCPTCGTQIADPIHRGVAKWFWFMVVVSVIYLGYRTYQGIEWLTHR